MRHAIRRGKERTPFDFGSRDRERVTHLVRHGHSVVFGRSRRPGVFENHAVHYRGAWLAVGYDPKRKRLRTVLPMTDRTRRQILAAFLKRERRRGGVGRKKQQRMAHRERGLLARRTPA